MNRATPMTLTFPNGKEYVVPIVGYQLSEPYANEFRLQLTPAEDYRTPEGHIVQGCVIELRNMTFVEAKEIARSLFNPIPTVPLNGR